MDIFDAAERYRSEGTPLIILAGKEYGSGSSRDWAAKGPYLLGVKAVIAESFERIHRSNLVGMGIIPLEYLPGQNADSLGLTGKELYNIDIPSDLKPREKIKVVVSVLPLPRILIPLLRSLTHIYDVCVLSSSLSVSPSPSYQNLSHHVCNSMPHVLFL